MATTLSEIAVVLCEGIESAVRSEGGPWRRIDTPGDGISAADADGTYRALPTGRPTRADAFGHESEQVLEQRFTVALHRMLAGDPHVEEPDFLDEARAVADAIERTSHYPAGTEAVVLEDRGEVERGYGVAEDGDGSVWARIRMTVRVVFTAPFGA